MSAAFTSCPEDSTSWHSFPSFGSSVMFPNPGEEGINKEVLFRTEKSTQELFSTLEELKISALLSTEERGFCGQD